MNNEFKYDYGSVLGAYSCASKAKVSANEMISLLAQFDSLASGIDVSGLSNLSDSGIKEQLNNAVSFESNLSSLKSEVVQDLLFSGNFDAVKLLNDGTLTHEELISICSEYIQTLAKNDPDYYNSLKVTSAPVKSLMELGLTEEDIQQINQAFCNTLIEKNLMYTGEGVAEAGLMFTGLLAMFGLKQDYELGGHFDSDSDGLYLGTYDADLTTMDCCNYYDWLCRCAGVNASGYAAQNKWYYSGYGSTGKATKIVEGYNGDIVDASQIHVTSESEYFTQAGAGDILTTDGNDMDHIRVIVSNDGNGYYCTESSSRYDGTVVTYYTYDELADNGYYVTNMDNFYSNITEAWRPSSNTDDGGYNFLTPSDISSQVKLDDAHTASLIEQYNSRNKNPNVAKASLIDINDGSTLKSQTYSGSFNSSTTGTSTNTNTGTSTNTTTYTSTNTNTSTNTTNTSSYTSSGSSSYSGTTSYSGTSSSSDSSSSSSTSNHKIVNLNDGDTTNNIDYILKSYGTNTNTNTNTSTNTSTTSGTTKTITNNYYYGNSGSSSSNTSTNTNTTSDILTETNNTGDILNEVITDNKEITGDILNNTVTGDILNSESNKTVTNITSTPVSTNTSSDSSSVLPAVGAVLGVGAAAVVGKALYDKYNENNEYKEDTKEEKEEVKPRNDAFGFGTNFEGASNLNTDSDKYTYTPDSAEDYYE